MEEDWMGLRKDKHLNQKISNFSQITQIYCELVHQQSYKWYKEKHDLVVVHGSDQSYNSDEQQEDAHRNDPSDNVDAGHQAVALPPCRDSDQQQPDQLKGAKGKRLTTVSWGRVHQMDHSLSRGHSTVVWLLQTQLSL